LDRIDGIILRQTFPVPGIQDPSPAFYTAGRRERTPPPARSRHLDRISNRLVWRNKANCMAGLHSADVTDTKMKGFPT